MNHVWSTNAGRIYVSIYTKHLRATGSISFQSISDEQ